MGKDGEGSGVEQREKLKVSIWSFSLNNTEKKSFHFRSSKIV